MKKHITLFWGGTDSERTVSEMTRDSVMAHLDESRYDIGVIEVAVDETWLSDGQSIAIETALVTTDYAFIAMHGAYGEDGTLQKILDEYRIPYNGSDALTSHIAFSKSATKVLYQKNNIKTPLFETHSLSTDVRQQEELADYIFTNFPQPCVIKPDRGGSSHGVYFNGSLIDIKNTLAKLAISCNRVIVEQQIQGREVTVGVIDDFRDQRYYALPEVEIIPDNQFFDYDAKYKDQVQEICPGNFDPETKTLLAELAIKSHRAIGAEDYTRTDFIITNKGGIYTLETNTLPSLTEKSLLPKELSMVGVDLSDFLDHIISLKLS